MQPDPLRNSISTDFRTLFTRQIDHNPSFHNIFELHDIVAYRSSLFNVPFTSVSQPQLPASSHPLAMILVVEYGACHLQKTTAKTVP